MKKNSWIIMPVVDNLELTRDALVDCLAQELAPSPRVLLIDNGSSAATRRGLEALVAKSRHMALPVWHHPPLGGAPFGALNASWNFGLEFCWGQGAEEVLVVNNDVRLAPWTYALLREVMHKTEALWVSAVGVKEEEYQNYAAFGPGTAREVLDLDQGGPTSRGGPDFSCFLISKACHAKYPFDENFTYYGDNDYHRMLTLGGDADKIFSVNVPYLHYGSRTINRSPEVAEAYRAVFDEHKERYVRKWGGLPGEEKWERAYEGERFLRRQIRDVMPPRTLDGGFPHPHRIVERVAPTSVTDTPDEAR